MGDATRVRQLEHFGRTVIGTVAVGHEDATIAVEQSQRHRSPAGGVVVKEHDPPAGRTGSPDPHPVIGRGGLLALQDLQAGLIAVNHRLGEQ
jgi:hypothetical protein